MLKLLQVKAQKGVRNVAGKASVALVTQLVTDRAQVGMGTGKVLLVRLHEGRASATRRGPQGPTALLHRAAQLGGKQSHK